LLLRVLIRLRRMGPAIGLACLHLFCRRTDFADRTQVVEAVEKFVADGGQVTPVAMLGHKADIAFMALADDQWKLRRFQTALQVAGLEIGDSYVSLTEISEYAGDISEGMKKPRLYPQIPIEGKNAWCFYPMSKSRGETNNWFALDFEKRKELMHGHGKSGREFAGRVQQIVTGSTGLDDYEWGVTLFANGPEDLKEVVYTMRFDEASALYGEFGAFYTGVVGTLDQVLDATEIRNA
jgi:peroxiredoxin